MGKVLRVKVGAKGVLVDSCQHQMACPFTVVVFPRDLKHVGDVHQLAGPMIEIGGPVKVYNGRAKIALTRVSQLTGRSTLIPLLPKNYEVKKQGHYSAGRMLPHQEASENLLDAEHCLGLNGNEADAGKEPKRASKGELQAANYRLQFRGRYSWAPSSNGGALSCRSLSI
jgi:hypothetical protein